MGDELTPLAIKALLVHAADPSTHDKLEVGWGKVPENLIDIITCPAGIARVVYQGELKPGKYLRAVLPLPPDGLTGNIKLKATFCYASPTYPQDAASYTRAGLETVFRPIAIGKKNWLFAGSERAGKRAAAIQSLFATAKLNGIEPAAWLKDTLEKLPVWTMRRIDELLPIKPAA